MPARCSPETGSDDTKGEAKQSKLLAAGAHDRLNAEFVAAGVDPGL